MTDTRRPPDIDPHVSHQALSKALAERGFYVVGTVYPGQNADAADRLIATLKTKASKPSLWRHPDA